MLSYLIRPGWALAVALAALSISAGCGGAPKSPVKVIGVSDAHGRDASRMLLFFLEVRNPTKRMIQLSSVDYQLRANPWFATEGRLHVVRSISAGGSAVVEVPVRFDATRATQRSGSGVPYTFEGVLRVRSGSVDHSWPVRVEGELASARRGAQLVVAPAVTARE